MSTLFRWLMAAVVITLFTACDKEPTSSSQTETPVAQAKPIPMRPVEPATGEPISRDSFLRGKLPQDALAYARIPSFWGMIGTPTGGALDKAVGSAVYVEVVRSIREGFGLTVMPELPPEAQPMLQLLLLHARSPIEAAALAPANPKSPIPNVLVTVAVDFADIAALNSFLTDAASGYPMMTVMGPVQPDTPGMISFAGVPMLVDMDVAASRIYLLGGGGLSPTALQTTLQGLQPATAHPMYALESSVDSSGQGLFLWINSEKLMALANGMGQSGQMAMLSMFGGDDVKSIAIGMGGSGGTHRIKAVVDMPKSGFRAFIPMVSDAPTFSTAGEPTGIAVLGLPSKDDLVAFEAQMPMFSSPRDLENYQEFKQSFVEQMGFSIEDMLGSLGQDMTAVSDESGQYLAVRLKDAQKFHAMIDAAVERFGLKYSTREIGGHTYHHLIMPSLEALLPEDEEEELTNGKKLAKRFLETPSHTYWIEEDGYLIMAGIPQVLMDRNYITERVPVNEWLEKTQRMDAGGALLMASMRSEGLPSLMYRLNLEMLAYLGDVVERPVDMFALPTPREVGLPEAGSYGIKLTSNESQLALELTFETNPAELLFAGNGIGTVAAAGVLAAIAVPAYQDYVAAALLTQSVSSAESAQRFVEQFVANNGRYPNAEDLAGMDFSGLSGKYSVYVGPDEGAVVVEFFSPSNLAGYSLVYLPQQVDEQIQWNCNSDLPEEHMPVGCYPFD